MSAVSLALFVTWVAAAELPGVVQERAAGDWKPLFDGKTLDGWIQRGGKAKYRVEDGQIVGQTVPKTRNSFLCTTREYADFELELEYKVDPRLNSGIQIRSNSVPGYKNGVVHGYQVEIDPSDRAWSAGVYDESRRGWLNDLKQNEKARKAFKKNDWNHYRIRAVGDSIKTWINGVPAADLRDSLTRTGFIGLQVHGTQETEPLEIRWRNIRIKDLGDPSRISPRGAIPLLDDSGDVSAWQPVAEPMGDIGWQSKGGVLQIVPGAGDILTRRAFGDCRLHVEFLIVGDGGNAKTEGNSGVYIQGRYEVQILNSAGKKPGKNTCGAIYGVKAADYNMSRAAGQWQSFDMTFLAAKWDSGGKKIANARLTVYHNGTRIHDDVEIPNKTGAGRAEEPRDGPLVLQEHGYRIKFRNVWIAPLR
ncbi:MAG: DUF1080 domain-containing protein [Planctomycetes bacterium]|nr:DUF1080 domain-containing protein [Planctomycetota bacterium]